MSPLKIRILLLLIKENKLGNLTELIPIYLKVLPSQIPYLLETLKKLEFIMYNKKGGIFLLTQKGISYLEEWNLQNIKIEDMELLEYKINEECLQSYIPKK